MLPDVSREKIKVKTIDFFQPNEKIRVMIDIYEEWKNIFMRNIMCGEKFKRKFERKIGFKKEIKADIESVLNGKLGFSGLASMEAQIKSGFSESFTFDQWDQETEEIEIEAPKCGLRIIDLWQKIRTYHCNIIESKLFGDHELKLCITEYTNIILDNSEVKDYDPRCGCKLKELPPEEGELDMEIDNKYIFTSAYRLLKNKNIFMNSLNIDVPEPRFNKIFENGFDIENSSLPKYILFFLKPSTPVSTIKLFKPREEIEFLDHWIMDDLIKVNADLRDKKVDEQKDDFAERANF